LIKLTLGVDDMKRCKW